jgi:tetratricopeptide (TPR) repeat protein
MMHRSLFALLLAGTAPLLCASPVTAQMMPAPSGDADELAAQMRQLAANPQDLTALIRAGELALRLDDPTAAAGFFARAERIDPRNARIKAGLGSLLVGEERPGEALRRFAEAEALGADARGFAADRGLAYDLIGEQDRAQRDYRTALRNGPNDETVRRYALSLGISGKREEAYAVLEPLLRRSDRGAWRSRAFILAMSGDPVGANQIATSMLPAGMAQGLQPFFDRLPSLPAADRAFAVHFGEVRATPQRLADARLVPPLPVLGPDPYAPRAVAAVAAPAAVAARSDDRRRGRKRKGEPVQVAAATPTPPPLPAPPAYVASSQGDDEPLAPAASSLPPRPSYGQAIVQPLPAATLAAAPARRPPVTFSAAPVRPTVVAPTPTPAPTPAATSGQPPVALAANNTRVPLAAGPPNETVVPSQDSSGDEDGPVAPVTAARPQPVPVEVATVVPQPTSLAAPPPAAVVPQPTTIAAPPPAPVVPKPAPAVTRSAPAVAKPAPVRSEDSILASIIAGIKVPGSELAHTPPPPAAKPARATAVPAEKPAPGTVPAVKPGTRAADAAKAAAAAKKAAEEKRRNDPKLLEPARIWVQVAGGANEAALVMAWNTMKSRAPAAFKGRQGWTTPLRATHRVLAGPFKTDDEARAFVNTLAKSGVQAFAFTSEAGQKITKLPTK